MILTTTERRKYHSHLRWLIAACAVALAGGVSVHIAGWNGWKLTASDATPTTLFGISVAISDDVAVIGASGFNPGIPGAAYVFRDDGTGWVEQQKLLASDGAVGDRFGRSVAVSGDVSVVGDSSHDGGTGTAYVFRDDGSDWVEEQKLSASDGAMGDGFGWSVAVFDQVSVIGAGRHDGDTGAAYVFRDNGTGWVEEQKLSASDGATWDRFGWSVAVSGDVAVVGSWSEAAYMFRYDGTRWIEEQKLIASDPTFRRSLRSLFSNFVGPSGA